MAQWHNVNKKLKLSRAPRRQVAFNIEDVYPLIAGGRFRLKSNRRRAASRLWDGYQFDDRGRRVW